MGEKLPDKLALDPRKKIVGLRAASAWKIFLDREVESTRCVVAIKEDGQCETVDHREAACSSSDSKASVSGCAPP